MSNYKLHRNDSQLDADVNMITTTRRGKRQVRETDGRFVKVNFSERDLRHEAAKAAEWNRQMELYGEILFA
jgi:hypothetical protein